MPDGQQRSAGSALVVVSDVRGNGTSVSILDWDLTPERPYVPTTSTTIEPTTTTSTTTTVKPTTTTSTTTTVTPTTTTSTTVKPTTTTVPAGPSPATWTVRVTSDWTEGYCAEFTVTNPTPSSLTWIVDVPIEGQITSFWNGEYTRSGNTLRVRGASWNHTITAGATTGFGLCSIR
jgi:cellulase/cellobiase CelA1